MRVPGGGILASGPGLALLHRLVMTLQVVCVEVGACGIRLVWRFLKMTGLNRFVGASYGTQQEETVHLANTASTFCFTFSTHILRHCV